jgi:multidrug efflux system membrane fusion protein
VLVEQDSAPRQQLDTQAATVNQLEGTLKSDQAQIQSANLNLTQCRMAALITQRVGLRLVDPGNIVHASDRRASSSSPAASHRAMFTIPETACR